MNGVFKNYNTIEELRATETKKELFNAVTDSVSEAKALCVACVLLTRSLDTRIVQDGLPKPQPILARHICRPQEIRVSLLVRLPRARIQTRLGPRRRWAQTIG